MPNIPVRGLGKYGVITDRASYDLPIEAWSNARNVRFANGAVLAYPAFKHLSQDTPLTKPTPSFLFTDVEYSTPSLVLIDQDYTIQEFDGGTVHDRTPTDPTHIAAGQIPTTSCRLGGVRYINRAIVAPLYRSRASGPRFAQLPNWPALTLCTALRKFGDHLVALNVTKNNINYPHMVKWSDIALGGAVPGSWDVTDPTNLAGETVLNEMTTPIVDGGEIRDAFAIYTESEVFLAQRTGDNFVFAFRRVFGDDGIINQNCYIEVGGMHYVFGRNDLYVHDGIQRQSLASGLIRNFVFGNLDRSNLDRCFVLHHVKQNEVLFCFPSRMDELHWRGVSHCNVAVAYNYVEKTWTILDMPNVVAGDLINMSDSPLWSQQLQMWAETGISWRDLSSGIMSVPVFASAGSTELVETPQLFALDSPIDGAINRPVRLSCRFRRWAEREQIDLDQIGASIESRKLLRKLFPQITLRGSEDRVLLQLGRSSFSGATPLLHPAKTFDPQSQYKYDIRSSARYFSMLYEVLRGEPEFTGYDADIEMIGMR